EDIADVAVAALTDTKHVGEVYELSGPRSLTFSEVTKEIAKATRREIQYINISIESFTTELRQQGMSEEMVSLMEELFTEVLDGRNSHVVDGVERALGRDPRSFIDYVKSAATTGIWEDRK